MKEISIQEKAQLYDEAIERAKKWRNAPNIDKIPIYGNRIIEEIFPELKEIENERIKTAILNHLKKMWGNSQDDVCGVHVEDAIAWLEKQGEYLENYDDAEKEKADFVGDGFIECHADFLDFKEGNTYWLEYIGDDKYNVRSDNLLCKTYHITPCQLYTVFKKLTWLEKQGKQETLCDKCRKDHPSHSCQDITELRRCAVEHKPADKIEPKFNIGDWVVNKFGDSWHIDSLDKKNYQVSDGKGNYNYFPISKQDEMHLWTIQDAKDGDVLEFEECRRLVVGIVSYINKSTGKVCWLENNRFKSRNYYDLDTINPHPASREKRDALMKAMADAGYEWDSEKKELKYKLTAFEDAIKDMMDDYRDAIDEDGATAEEVKKRSEYLLSLIPYKQTDWSENEI